MSRSGYARSRIRGRASLFKWKEKTGPIHSNNRGELCIAQALPPNTEVVRLGKSWSVKVQQTVGVGLPPPAFPNLQIWNGERPGGLTYVIDAVGFSSWDPGAWTIGCAEVMLRGGPLPRPVGESQTKNIFPALGRRGTPAVNRVYPGNAVVMDSGASVPDEGWHFVGPTMLSANLAVLTMSVEHQLKGRYLVPPGGTFYLAIMQALFSSVNVIPQITWHEVQF